MPGGRKGKRGPRSDGKRFFDAILWLARSSGRWRDLPERFAPYQTAKRVRFMLGPGQQNDMPVLNFAERAPAYELIDGLAARQVLAEKAYDANSQCEKIEVQGGTVVIPPRRHRKQPRQYDRIAYTSQWSVEGFFAKLKQRRRNATRYDKLASTMLWLK